MNGAPSQRHTTADYAVCEAALRNHDLAQALYEAGEVVMKDVLLTLHGDAHRQRKQLELRVFRRNFFRYYEQDVFPATLEQTMAPFEAAGGADLIELGYRLTINLTADFAGIDRPKRSVAETEALLELVKTFSAGATLVHSTRPKADVEAEVRIALERFQTGFVKPSADRRKALLSRFAAGELAEADLPRDVLTVLLRNEDSIDLPEDVLLREMAFCMQAGAHSTANATVHAVHEIWQWAGDDAARWARLRGDALFVQQCVHESLRLHPASPEAWRKAMCPVELPGLGAVPQAGRVVLDLFAANRSTDIFGSDADDFRPGRTLPTGVLPFGLTFGVGLHTCLGRELDGGLVARPDTDPASHQYGIVTLVVRRLLALGAQQLPDDPPRPDPNTSRPNWGRYPVAFHPQEQD